jgi:hypothetical protein
MNEKEFLIIKAAIYEMGLLFNQQPTDERINAYAKALSNYTPAQIKFAFNSVILSGSAFFPSLAEILNHLRPMTPKADDKAAELMEEVVRVAIEHGHNRTERAIAALSPFAREVLGDDHNQLIRICKSYEDELPTIKAQLRNLFRARLEAKKSDTHNGKLIQLGVVRREQIEGLKKLGFSTEEA